MESDQIAKQITVIPGRAYLYRSVTINKKLGKKYIAKKWYGKWMNAADKWVAKALCEDLKSARKMLLKLYTGEELETLSPRFVPLRTRLEQFRQGIAATSTPAYSQLIHRRALAVIDHIEATRPEHLEPGKVTLALAEIAEGLRTRNHYQAAVKQFCRWLLDNGHASRNPLASLKPSKHEADKRYVRRAMTQEEWALLCGATRSSVKRLRGMTGQDRLALYTIALSTGWRVGGLAQLRVSDYRNDGLLILQAKYSKNRKEQRKFLPTGVAEAFKAHLAGRNPTGLIWPGTWGQDAAEMLRIDLKAAGIPHINQDGILDMHSMRNTSITWLLEAGTPIYLVQKHADHANPAQTMKYARPKRGSVDEAVDKALSGIMPASFS